MELNKSQLLILEGKVCPYCKKKTKFVDSKVIYKTKSFGMIYLCEACDAYVGTHKDTQNALGRLANVKLRQLKKETHKHFDLLWDIGIFTRKGAYKALSEHLNLPTKYTHIGMFSERTCEKVISWSKIILKENTGKHNKKLLTSKERIEKMFKSVTC